MTDRDREIEQHVQVPLTDFVTGIVVKAVTIVIEKHIATCPCPEAVKDLEKRTRRTEMWVAAMVGSGLLGGTAGALLAKLL